jgi:arylsulfatase A-like enzyme
VIAVDLLPTVAATIGAALPQDRKIDGRNWLPLLQDPSAPGRDVLFWKQGNQSAVRKDKWKLVMHPATHGDGNRRTELTGDDTLFLSDLASDPGERRNLRHEHPEIVRDLQNLHKAWLADVQTAAANLRN